MAEIVIIFLAVVFVVFAIIATFATIKTTSAPKPEKKKVLIDTYPSAPPVSTPVSNPTNPPASDSAGARVINTSKAVNATTPPNDPPTPPASGSAFKEKAKSFANGAKRGFEEVRTDMNTNKKKYKIIGIIFWVLIAIAVIVAFHSVIATAFTALTAYKYFKHILVGVIALVGVILCFKLKGSYKLWGAVGIMLALYLAAAFFL